MYALYTEVVVAEGHVASMAKVAQSVRPEARDSGLGASHGGTSECDGYTGDAIQGRYVLFD